jgi:hypothetical protein
LACSERGGFVPQIDPVATAVDLNSAIVFGESSIEKAPFFLLPELERPGLLRLLAQLQSIVNDPVAWPALVAFVNALSQGLQPAMVKPGPYPPPGASFTIPLGSKP